MNGFDGYAKQLQKISESLQKMCEPFGYISGYFEAMSKFQNQFSSINMVSNVILEFHGEQKSFVRALLNMSVINEQFAALPSIDCSALTSLTASLGKMDGIMETVRSLATGLQLYNYDVLSSIMQETFNRLDYSLKFDINSFADEIVEQYIQEEVFKNKILEENVDSSSKKQHIIETRDWILAVLTIIGFLMGIYSMVSTKPSITYNNTTEINNYYTIKKNIDADCLNELSYRIINRNDVMPRIKPDCSSTVRGHLNIGQIVVVQEMYKKWALVSWEDENGEEIRGWIQNYKITEFK